MGSGLIYGALFQIFWRGNSFEFFAGTLMWSVIVMVLLFQAGRYFGLLVPAASNPHFIPGKSGVALGQPAVAIRRNVSRLGSGRIPSQ
jgi:hypothetical protein